MRKELLLILLLSLLSGCAKNQVPETPDVTPAPVASSSGDPVETASLFYETYLMYPGNPLELSAYRENPALRIFLSDALVAAVDETIASFDERGGGYDPFLCAQDRPSRFSFELKNLDASSATVISTAIFSGSEGPRSLIELQRIDGQWLLDRIDCSYGREIDTVELLPSPATAVREGGNQDDWASYQDPDLGFEIGYPAHWLATFNPVLDPNKQDPVEGYIIFSDNNGIVPVALIVIQGPEEVFRLVFPQPENGVQEKTIAGYPVTIEEINPGEFYTLFTHPENDELRIAIRVIDREGSLPQELTEIVNRMLASFRFDGES